MIGIDTNILVRFITNDDQALHERADQFLTAGISSHNRGFVNLVVMCELVWTLRSRYGATRPEISNIVQFLLETDTLVIEEPDVVARALRLFNESKADFADCLTGQVNHKAGCDHSVTFDKTTAKLEGFKLLR